MERETVVIFAPTAASAERGAAFALHGALEQHKARARARGRGAVAAADHARADERIARDLGGVQGEAGQLRKRVRPGTVAVAVAASVGAKRAASAVEVAHAGLHDRLALQRSRGAVVGDHELRGLRVQVATAVAVVQRRL